MSRGGDAPPVGRLRWIRIDCPDPERLAGFWADVPEPKVGTNRLHLDLQVGDVDAACARIEGLGGRRRDDFDFHEHGYSWRRMADPDGNEFCLIYGA
jgi:predicted enzyme related to lactoylglutathione lyase